MARKKSNKKAPTITIVIGIILVGASYWINQKLSSGFLYNVNSDTFGVGLALVVAGIIWYITRVVKK